MSAGHDATAAPGARPLRLADQPHHDGSTPYTQPGPYVLGATVEIRVRVPDASRADRVRVRCTPDAEPLLIEARVDRVGASATWWVADLPLHNPVTTYRFLFEGGATGYGWLNQAGVTTHDVADAWDFRISTHGAAPAWLHDTVGYEIFLDRFANSGAQRELPDWALAQDWETAPEGDARIGPRQFYGGDLPGIEKHLDHLERVGVNLIYLTPFFPAGSTHRYDASSFAEVDPLLGGNDALVSLIAAAHARDIRVVGDVTLNHTGDRHEWFSTARSDPDAIERGFYMFEPSTGEYVAWHDVASLPKLDHRSAELARRLHDGPASVIARYLDPPFELDGWRIDCANTTARHADVDLTRHVAVRTRATVDEHTRAGGRGGWLVAEHCYDAADDLDGDGWHGVMAYQWFTRPLWSWLVGDRAFALMSQIDVPHLGGASVVRSMRELGGTVSWAARAASMTMLDSHDTARFRTAVGGDPVRHLVGVAALLTVPGVPTIFAGSEIGVQGDSMDSCRVPFPWHDDDAWDHDLLAATSTLIRIRAASDALREGGLRWIDATDDTITFVREAPTETIAVHLRRAPGGRVRIPRTDLVDAPPAGAARSASDAVEQLFGAAVTVLADGSIEFPATPGAVLLRLG